MTLNIQRICQFNQFTLTHSSRWVVPFQILQQQFKHKNIAYDLIIDVTEVTIYYILHCAAENATGTVNTPSNRHHAMRSYGAITCQAPLSLLTDLHNDLQLRDFQSYADGTFVPTPITAV